MCVLFAVHCLLFVVCCVVFCRGVLYVVGGWAVFAVCCMLFAMCGLLGCVVSLVLWVLVRCLLFADVGCRLSLFVVLVC